MYDCIFCFRQHFSHYDKQTNEQADRQMDRQKKSKHKLTTTRNIQTLNHRITIGYQLKCKSNSIVGSCTVISKLNMLNFIYLFIIVNRTLSTHKKQKNNKTQIKTKTKKHTIDCFNNAQK